MHKKFSLLMGASAIIISVMLSSSSEVNASTYYEEDYRSTKLNIDLDAHMQDTFRYIQKIKSKAEDATSSVIVVGESGHGKSTLIQFIAGRKLEAIKEKGSYRPSVINPLEDFIISHGSTGTEMVTAWYDKIGKTIYWDCPGFGDPAGGEKDLCNAYSIYQLFRNSGTSKILLVTQESILNTRITKFREILDQIKGFFPETEHLMKAMALVVTKTGSICELKDVFEMLNDGLSPRNNLSENSQELIGFFANENNARVSLFPAPQEPGTFSPLNARDSILTSIKMAEPVDKFDVQVSVSDKSKACINQLHNDLNKKIITTVENFGTEIIKSYFLEIVKREQGKAVSHIRDVIGVELSSINSYLENLKQDENSAFAFHNFLSTKFSFNFIGMVDSLGFLKRLLGDNSFDVASWVQPMKVSLKGAQYLAQEPAYDLVAGNLTIRGLLLGAQDVPNIWGRLRENSTLVRSISMYAFNTLIIDENIRMPGVSMTLISPHWRIIGDSRMIDVSGTDGRPYLQKSAVGIDGMPGNPGGDAGHIYAKIGTIENPERLMFKANGGNGGDGQDGANGLDGTNGQNADLEGFTSRRITGQITDVIPNHGDGHQTTSTRTYYRIEGTNGQPGGIGQRCGIGGLGGFGGIIEIEYPLADLNRESINGAPGQDGQVGNPGVGGIHGIGYKGAYETDRVRRYKEKKKGHMRHKEEHLKPVWGWGVGPSELEMPIKRAPNGEIRDPNDSINTEGQQQPEQVRAIDIQSKKDTYREEYKIKGYEYIDFMKAFPSQ